MGNRLEEIKDEIAKECGYKNFSQMYMRSGFKETKGYIARIAKIYAIEVAQASLEKASQTACIEPKGMMTRVEKESITNPENIVLL